MTILMLESSKCWNITKGNPKFIIVIHSETIWKIDVWKTGGLLYFSPASTSHDMTQPADNINSTTTRHMSMTVICYNDVVHYAADMQTQSTESDNKDQAIISKQNITVIDDIINDEKNSSSGVSKHFCKRQMRSRYDVTHNGFHEESIQHFVCEEAVDIYCFIRPSPCNYGNRDAAQIQEGIIINYEEKKIISLDTLECSCMVTQDDSGCNGTNQITVFANQFDFMTEKRMTFDGCIAVQAENTINGNSTGTRPCSSRLMNYPSLKSDRTTKLSHNINALGGACIHSYQTSLQQASVESELGTSMPDFKRTGDSFLSTKHCRVQDSIYPLALCLGQNIDTMISQLISGQEKMVVVPDDSKRIHDYMNENPKFDVNRLVMHLPDLSIHNSDGTKRNYEQIYSLLEAVPPANAEEFLSCPNSPSSLGLQAQECLSSPSAPQVEKNVLETTSTSDKCAQLAKNKEKPRTRSAARAERFTTPASREISNQEQESYNTFVPRSHGTSKLSDKHNIPEDYCKHERVFTENLRGQQAPRDIKTQLLPERVRQVQRLGEPSGSSYPRLRVRPKIGRKTSGAPLPQLTSASMSDTTSSGASHPQLTVASMPETASAGAYDDLPEPVSNDESGSDM